jgi:Lipoprotein LpqB beta-propeller domain/Sporulation and spore germination
VASRPTARGPKRPVLAVLAALAITVSAAGCISMPTGGTVQSYTETQGPGTQSQHYQQIDVQGPGDGWSPEQIVNGFLIASASFANRQQIAREYMTPQVGRSWRPSWSAFVYSNGPSATRPVLSGRDQAAVTVTGTVQANLSTQGGYAVASAKDQVVPPTFQLTKVDGQWRISQAPSELLLSSDLFKYDYQLRNLYFFDPTGHFLVPDPVYVPLQTTPTDLMNGLVHDLISPPKRDWLSRGATSTAFLSGTKQLGDVTLTGGTAAVNLGGAIVKAPTSVLQQVSAQLWWTLSGSGQGGPAVQSIEVSKNGKPWIPLNSDENPVQHQPVFNPPTGATGEFYYLDSAGNLLSRTVTGTQVKPARVGRVGAGFSQIAVSPDGRYVAAMRDGSLFIGPVNGKLSRRDGAGYMTMSWDPADNLWATTGDQIVMLRGTANPAQAQGQPVTVNVVSSDGITPVGGQFTSLRVAPDGVRVAVIVNETALDFGAIVWQQGARPTEETIEIVLSPFYVTASGVTTFSSVTWYGSDNVITLGDPGSSAPSLTEYPVNGSSSTSIPAQPRIQSITASWGSPLPLIAGLAKGGGVTYDASLTGSWNSLGSGVSPAYPG